MKLYLINLHEAYMAAEQGINAVRNLPDDSAYYRHEVLEETDIELPIGFTLEKTQGGGEEIFHGSEAADMVTEYKFGRYITSLITSDGLYVIHTWDYGK